MIPIRDKNPTDLFPLVTISIIIANIVAFTYELLQLLHGTQYFEAFIRTYAIVPRAFIANPLAPAQLTSMFTSMFLHGGVLHLGGNMLFLWIFGNNVEDYLGHFKFALFYLACGVGATLTHVVTQTNSPIPVIGASGAISGVLGAYFLLFPRARVLTVVPVVIFLYFVEVPAFFFLGVYIIFQILYGISDSPDAAQNIAWFAHIGGFFAGILLLFFFRKRRGFRKRVPY